MKKIFLIVLVSFVLIANVKAQNISIIQPANEHTYSLQELCIFSWNGTEDLTPGDIIYYTVRAAKCDGMYPSEALETQPLYMNKSTNPSDFHGSMSLSVDSAYQTMSTYAWQVTCYDTDNNIIGLSEVYVFYTPYPFGYFIAGNQYIYVSELESHGNGWYSGEGTTSITPEPENLIETVVYDSIRLIKSSGRYHMTEGNIYDKIDSLSEINLIPIDTFNTDGVFYTDSLWFLQYDLKIKGYFQGTATFPVSDLTDTLLTSKSGWGNYNSLIPYSNLGFNERVFDEFYPSLKIKDASTVALVGNKYKLYMHGEYLLDTIFGQEVIIPFETHSSNFTYFENTEDIDIEVLSDLNINISLLNTTIDLSTDTSFNVLTDNPTWTGVLIDTAKISFNPVSNSFLEIDDVFISDTIVNTPSFTNRIDSLGLQFQYSIDTAINCNLYGFEGSINNMQLNVTDNSLSSELFTGTIKIPYISDEDFEFKLTQNEVGDTATLTNPPVDFYMPTGDMEIDTISFVTGDTTMAFKVIKTNDWSGYIALDDSCNSTGVLDFIINANTIVAGVKVSDFNTEAIQVVRGITEINLKDLSYIRIYGKNNSSVNSSVNYSFVIGQINVDEVTPSDIKLFPNPVTDMLNITVDRNIDNLQISVYDMSSKKVLSDNVNGNNISVNVSNLNSGIYFIKIENDKFHFVRKFVKR